MTGPEAVRPGVVGSCGAGSRRFWPMVWDVKAGPKNEPEWVRKLDGDW